MLNVGTATLTSEKDGNIMRSKSVPLAIKCYSQMSDSRISHFHARDDIIQMFKTCARRNARNVSCLCANMTTGANKHWGYFIVESEMFKGANVIWGDSMHLTTHQVMLNGIFDILTQCLPGY